MTEEEKESIRYLKQIQQDFLNSAKQRREKGEDTGYGTLEDVDKLSAFEIGIVLNLIERQDRQIEKFKNKNKDLLRKLRNRVKEVNKLIKYSAYKKEFSRLNAIIEQRDRQIDLMAEHIERGCDFDSRIQTKEQIKQYFTEQAKEV